MSGSISVVRQLLEAFDSGVLYLVYGPDEAREGGFEEARAHLGRYEEE